MDSVSTLESDKYGDNDEMRVSRLKFDIYAEYYAVGNFDDRSVGRQSRDCSTLRLGAGVEAKVTGGISSKCEYRYTNYNNWKSMNDYTHAYGYSNNTEFMVNHHQAIAAIGYRF